MELVVQFGIVPIGIVPFRGSFRYLPADNFSCDVRCSCHNARLDLLGATLRVMRGAHIHCGVEVTEWSTNKQHTLSGNPKP
jgi:hypothetical protein